jgi:4-aminobutyrate aminotransferase-like enzyme/Ser/Thr protein kinase RdoA (MazF antagonist)
MASADVLQAPPPRFSAAAAAALAERLFGVRGTASELGSERDQTFLVDDGARGAVLKISNAGEDPAVLDLETRAVLHARAVDPALPLAAPVAGADGYVAVADGPDGRHLVRLFERLRGGSAVGADLDDAALRAYGATHARLTLALRGFFHPAAGRRLLWDVARTAELRPLLPAIAEPRRRRLVEEVLDHFDERVAPAWPRLRAQVVHGDLNLDNVLLDGRRRIAGIVDFGDCSHTALVADFAIGLASLVRGRSGDDVFRAARVAIDGFASRLPLEPEELAVLGDLVAARLAAIVVISAWRTGRYPENAEYIQAWDATSWALLEQLAAAGPDAVATELGAPRRPPATAALAARRRAALGSALTPPTYRRPVHLVRGEGVWLEDVDGRRLLDAYNNVPVVGHCHPRVNEAIVRQTRALSTNARYLYAPLVELAERLVESMPAESGLDTVMLVNSGSEANDLAWRIATAATGGSGAIVTSFAYHGVTTATADLSPEEWPAGFRPPHVETIEPAAPAVARAAEALVGRRAPPAATFLDTGFTSDGILTPPAEALAAIAGETRAAGALLVADEVQAGHGRTGGHLWSFAALGLRPDLVTLGKPMGDGYPVAAVVARAGLVDRLGERTSFFSTFGGNPVAACAALAVLDVIEDERLVEHAAAVGARLRAALGALRHPDVVDVRGRGLLVGVELRDAVRAEGVVDAMRDAGVLIGRTGPHGNVLKIRPPLVFEPEHVDLLVGRLEGVLAGR